VERETLEGQGHMVDPKALAPVLKRFLEGDLAPRQAAKAR
jgi:hypothetical protein